MKYKEYRLLQMGKVSSKVATGRTVDISADDAKRMQRSGVFRDEKVGKATAGEDVPTFMGKPVKDWKLAELTPLADERGLPYKSNTGKAKLMAAITEHDEAAKEAADAQ